MIRPMRPFPATSRRSAFARTPRSSLFVLALGGCARDGSVGAAGAAAPCRCADGAAAAGERRAAAPAVNLSGFPLPYRQGYADGCASATGPERKDAVRFGADGNYRTGWNDGLALCRKK